MARSKGNGVFLMALVAAIIMVALGIANAKKKDRERPLIPSNPAPYSTAVPTRSN